MNNHQLRLSMEIIMAVLVLGATGATGQCVVQDLLDNGQSVIALVRQIKLDAHPSLEQIQGTVLSLDDSTLIKILSQVNSVISCLGHNMTLKGIYGAPKMLVRDSLKRLCLLEKLNHTSSSRTKPLKIFLMNSTGNRNLDLAEPVSISQHIVLSLIRNLVPPHLDNERAANYLRCELNRDKNIEWVVVRPDSLIDKKFISGYRLSPSPTRSAIFNAGQTSRINAANFMARLSREIRLFDYWKGRMPVIYNDKNQVYSNIKKAA